MVKIQMMIWYDTVDSSAPHIWVTSLELKDNTSDTEKNFKCILGKLLLCCIDNYPEIDKETAVVFDRTWFDTEISQPIGDLLGSLNFSSNMA